MTLNVGVVGCGYFGQFHLNAWQRIEGVSLAGVVVRSAERRNELAPLYPKVTFYASLDEMLDAQTLDLLDVTTPPDTHDMIIRPLLGQIKTIICQKPFCHSLDVAEKLARDADTSDTVLVVHENFRFMPWYRAIKAVLNKGELGTIRQAQFRMRPGDGEGQNAYLARQPYFRDMPRFLVHETGIHWVDTFRYLFGEPESIYADVWRTNGVIKGEDSGLLVFGFKSGLRAVYDANRTLDHPADNHRLTMGEFIIEGSDAILTLNGFGTIDVRQRGNNQARAVDYTINAIDFGGDCVFNFQHHVIAHLLKGEPLETSALDYLKNMAIEEKIYQSAERGERLAL